MANGKTLISCGFAGFWACFDLLITNQLLYQLSHTSTKQSYFFDRFVIILKKKLLVKAKLHFFNI